MKDQVIEADRLQEETIWRQRIFENVRVVHRADHQPPLQQERCQPALHLQPLPSVLVLLAQYPPLPWYAIVFL